MKRLKVSFFILALSWLLFGCQQKPPDQRYYLEHPYVLMKTVKHCQGDVDQTTAGPHCQAANKAAGWLREQLALAMHGQAYYGGDIMNAQKQLTDVREALSRFQAKAQFSEGKRQALLQKRDRLAQLVAKKQAVIRFMFIAGT